MTGLLEKNAQDGTSTIVTNLPLKGTIRCDRDGCEISYSLYYNEDENYMSGDEKNVDIMEHMATIMVSAVHPAHHIKTYIWKGHQWGWMEANSQAA